MSTFPIQLNLSREADFAKPVRGEADSAAAELVLDCLVIGEETDELGSTEFAPIGVKAPTADPAVEAEIAKLQIAARLDHDAGRKAELKATLEKILSLRPDDARANFNLGVLLRDARNYPEAEARFRHAILHDPKNTTYHLALGELMQMMRHLLFAAEAYENGLAIDPHHGTMLRNLVSVRQRQRMPDKVAELSRRLLALDPQSESATTTLAWALIWLGEVEEAAEVSSRALSLNPQSIRSAVMLQICLKRLGRVDAAMAAMQDITDRSLALWDTCAMAAETFAQFEERDVTETILKAVIAKQPDFVPALLQLARHKILTGDALEGERLMERVAALDPEEGDAQTSVSLTKIRNGDYAEGWSRHHWRWKRSGCEPKWDLPLTEWDGQPLDKGGLVIWREQGIGDMVMYGAMAIACRPIVSRIAIETNPRLVALFQRSFPDMIACYREKLPSEFWSKHGITAHCPIGDLPHLLKVDMSDYPGRSGFLIADSKQVIRLRERYRLLFPGKKLIGISWRSGNSGSAITRSVELPFWQPIFETPDCAFISLQYGNIEQDVDEFRRSHGFEVYIDSEIDAMKDMDSFAAQVTAMDLIVSVDNSTVHMAGALGKPTFVMIPAASDWRWLQPERRDTVWYASLELFRNKPGQDWSAVIAEIATRLAGCEDETFARLRQTQYLRSAEQARAFGGKYDAEQYYRAILAEAPKHAGALAGLGAIALETGHNKDAIGLLGRAATIDSRQISYWRDYIKALLSERRMEDAAKALREAMSVDNRNQEVLLLGIEIYQALRLPEEVGNYCARLLRLDPEHRQARLYLAALQAANGDFDTSETNYKKVLSGQPDDSVAAYALGCLALRRGDYVAGWNGYRYRFAAGVGRVGAELKQPDLTDGVLGGMSLGQQRLAIRPEAGLRDQIMFSRWLKAAKREADFVAAEVDPRLIPLLSAAMPDISLFPSGSFSEEDAAGLDLTGQIALADLGGRYGVNPATFGETVPYLHVDLIRAAALRQDYRAALSSDRLIGLCWRGGDLAIPLALWRPILRMAGYGFVSLQPGPAQQELHEVFDSLDLQAVRDPSIDPQSNLRSYAAQLAAMDLVIAVDDVTAHLAAALGVTTACLVPRVADWRWLSTEHRETPWYPSMRLYRQGDGSDWASAMSSLAQDMEAMIERSKGAHK
ncbi:tetratricopeptide repeat protein [Dongia soli]|uniref:Tetratricopeptide repeat protein n=1 Tax=Dongia soli TaxID=600628 RepID=A0ABU5E9B6_9PROT|nr:tetratricopeptide repeat protein [Dongia soli]MDY0882824.1 tetratricopeptide repeat protein [Dongia soli]